MDEALLDQHPSPSTQSVPDFLTGGGEMGALMRAHDWSSSSLGNPETWPQSLRAIVALMINSRYAMFIAWGKDLNFLYNDAYAPIFGAKHPHMLGRPFREAWSEIWDDISPLIDRALAGEATYNENMHLVMKRNGYPEDTWYSFSYSPIRDESGGVAGMFCACTETTQQVLARRETESAREKQQAMLQQMPGFVALMSGPEHRFDYVNEAFIELNGKRNYIGRTVREMFPELEAQGFLATLDRVYSTGDSFAANAVPIRIGNENENRFLNYIYQPVRDDTGKVTGIFSGGFEVTESVRNEAALKESEERFRLIADSAPVPIWVTQLDRNRSFVNRAYVDFVGTSYEEALTFDWRTILHPDDADRVLADSIAGEASLEPFVLEARYRRGDGEWRWLQSTSQPRFDANGNHQGFIGVAHDITEAKNAEIALRDSDARFRFLDRLAEATQTGEEPEAVMAAATRLLGEHLAVDICAYADVEADSDAFHIRRDWTSPGIPSIVGSYSLDDFGTVAAAAQRSGSALVVRNAIAELGEEQAATFTSIGIAATICLPLVKQGRLAAMMAVHSAAPRADWTDKEISLVWEVAERCWAHVERVGANAVLRESERKFREQFENANDFIFTTDLEMHITSCNPAVAAALERSPEELIGRKISEFTPPETWEHNKAMLAAKLDGKGDATRYEVEVFDAEGQRMMWEINSRLIRDDSGTAVGLHAIGRDVSERKRAESLRIAQNRMLELAASEAPLADLLDALLETVETESRSGMLGSILLVDNDGEHLRHGAAPNLPDAYNQAVDGIAINSGVGSCGTAAFLREPVYVGDIATDPLWNDFRDLALAHDLRACWSTPITTTTGTLQGTFAMYYRTPREPTPGDLQLVDFVTRSASLVIERKAAEAELHDLNKTLEERVIHRTRELEQAQEALRQSQKLEAMGQLTGGVAHDFNNLLTPILGSLDLLQRRGTGDEREQRLIEGALQSAERAKLLVQRLLAFARRQPLKPVAVDVRDLLSGMAELVGSTCGPNIKVSVAVDDGITPALADPNQLEMAILNLSVNARDAMPDGGRLTLSAMSETVENGGDGGLPAGHYVRISVADTGTGMDEATMQRSIEPFFSTKGIGRGTGLGLSMAHGLASQLGGALRISSNPGIGTNVELWLPASNAPVESAAQTDLESVNEAKAGSILLVDDELLVRLSTADMLSELGYHVVEASSAEDALAKFDSDRFDMLVTDHLMPGMNGVDLVHALRQQQPDLPVLIVSGYAETNGVPSYLPRLTKPFRQADLAAAIAEIVPPEEPVR